MSTVALAAVAALVSQEGYTRALPFADMPGRFEEGIAVSPPRSFYVGGYQVTGRDDLQVVHFYAMDNPTAPRVEGAPYASIPVARRSSLADAHGSAEWADGRNCPGLYGVLEEYQRLQGPMFLVPPLALLPRNSGGLGGPQTPIHGPSLAVWGLARQADGALATMTLTAGSGRLQEWLEFADRQLASCWRPTQP